LLTTDEVGETAVTTPLTSVLARAESVTVAGCPTAIFAASASAKFATTSRLSSPSMVMKVDDELDDEEPVLDVPVLDVPVLDAPPEDPVPPAVDVPLPLPPAEEPAVPDDVPVEEVAVEPVDALVVDPDPLTVSPTELLTAVTVPLINAVSVVPATAF
jgi:hypothetical protein